MRRKARKVATIKTVVLLLDDRCNPKFFSLWSQETQLLAALDRLSSRVHSGAIF